MDLEDLDSDHNLSNSSGSDIELTATEVIALMEEAWINEKFAPEILPNKVELVECLLVQIGHMEENLSNLSKTDFKRGIHQMELDRLRFMVTSYLRTRLEKIETCVFHILNQEEERIKSGLPLYLSDSELEFAQSYRDSIKEHFESVLRFWPGLAPDQWKEEPVSPNMHSFVFLKSKTEVEGIVIDDANNDDSDLVDFNEGSQMIISYNSIHHLLKSGSVKLI